MNSYERVLTAMELGQPDRVPLMEFVIDPKVYKALLPGAKTQNDFEDHFDFDAVCCGVVFDTISQNADGTYYDEWGVSYQPTAELVGHPVTGPIQTTQDLANYRPPDPDAPHRLGRLPELVKKYKHKKAIVFHQRAAFMWSAYLMHIQEILMKFLIEPELVWLSSGNRTSKKHCRFSALAVFLPGIVSGLEESSDNIIWGRVIHGDY